ncbi:hypothetical protein PFISCL1PPCAC_5420, partial [Pristionchus fissidentatus]
EREPYANTMAKFVFTAFSVPTRMISTESSRRIKDIPTFDDEMGIFTPEAPASERSHDRLSVWAEHRDIVIKRIHDIADGLDSLKRKCDVSTVVGSTVGIGAGAAVIGGLILAPPVAIGGVVVGSLAAAANVTTSLVKVGVIRKRAREVVGLVQEDENLHAIFLLHLDELLKERRAAGDDGAEETGEEAIEIEEDAALSSLDSPLSKKQMTPQVEMATSVSVAVATGVSAAGARAAILETSRLAPMVAKGLAQGAAGLGILIDTLTLIVSSRDLLNGANLEYSVKLREVAQQLKQEMHAETAQFLKAILQHQP